MFKYKQNPIEAQLDKEIALLLEYMEHMPDKKSDDYKATVERFTSLYELRHKSRISKEALLTVGANVAGIVAILFHERAHVIATKALSLVRKIG